MLFTTESWNKITVFNTEGICQAVEPLFILIFVLFGRHPEQVDAQQAEDKIGNPYGHHGRQIPESGKYGGYLHKQDKGETDGDAHPEVEAYAPPHFPARK